jgi:hypothetical protein
VGYWEAKIRILAVEGKKGGKENMSCFHGSLHNFAYPKQMLSPTGLYQNTCFGYCIVYETGIAPTGDNDDLSSKGTLPLCCIG